MVNTTRILFVALGLLAIATLAGAQQASITFSPLVTSPRFRDRVTYIITQNAPVVLAEAQTCVSSCTTTGTYTAACHTNRAHLAATVAANPQQFASIFAAHLVTNVNVTSAGALTGTVAAGTLDTPATDASLLAAVALQWSTVSGCVVNP